MSGNSKCEKVALLFPLFFKNEKFNADKVHRRGEEKRDDKGDFGDDSKNTNGDF